MEVELGREVRSGGEDKLWWSLRLSPPHAVLQVGRVLLLSLECAVGLTKVSPSLEIQEKVTFWAKQEGGKLPPLS